MTTDEAPIELFESAIHPTPVYAMKGPDGMTGLLLDGRGGFAVMVDGEGLGVFLPPDELRRFGAFCFRAADLREPNRDLALMSAVGTA